METILPPDSPNSIEALATDSKVREAQYSRFSETYQHYKKFGRDRPNGTLNTGEV